MEIEGIFNIESYTISHKQLRIKHSQHFKVINVSEIFFSGVFFIQLPSYLENFQIKEALDCDRKYVEEQMKGFQINWEVEKVFVIYSMNNKYFIGASYYQVTTLPKVS